MILTFKTEVPLGGTMIFEQCYEDELQISLAEKRKVLDGGVVVWMYVDGKLAGECYGNTPHNLQESFPGYPSLFSVYCYSTTLLEEFRGKGLGKILVAYWNGMVQAYGYEYILGHATSPAMVAIRESFGAKLGKVTPNWCGSNRTATFYVIKL